MVIKKGDLVVCIRADDFGHSILNFGGIYQVQAVEYSLRGPLLLTVINTEGYNCGSWYVDRFLKLNTCKLSKLIYNVD